MTKQNYWVKALFLGCILGGCQSTQEPGDGCNTSFYNTILFEPALNEAGKYKFTLTVDGESGECEATLTGDDTKDDSCDPSSWMIYQKSKGGAGGEGSIEDQPRTDILGLLVGTEEVSEVSLKVTKDGSTLVDDTFEFKEVTIDDEQACEPYTRLQVTVPVPND